MATEAAEREIHHVPESRGRGRTFLAGFIAAIVAGIIAFGVWLAVSDDDNDGQIDIDVPAVDVDVDDGNPG